MNETEVQALLDPPYGAAGDSDLWHGVPAEIAALPGVGSCALIFRRDPEDRSRISPHPVQTAFALTQAEASVAAALAE
jgi:hypothetical protein